MNQSALNSSTLPEYRVRACNIAEDSENKIHDDTVAASYGFKGGLVPGVAVYAYITVPVVDLWGEDWLRLGSMSVKFLKPIYHGEEVIVRSSLQTSTPGDTASAPAIDIVAFGEDGETCAVAHASIAPKPELPLDIETLFPHRAMPDPASKLPAESSSLTPGTVLGTLTESLDLITIQQTLLPRLEERLPLYFGSVPAEHPILALSMANHILMQNVALGPWIHVSSDVANYQVARNEEPVSVRGKIADCFERKGHEFVVLDLGFFGELGLLRVVRHTAIYKIAAKD